MEWCRSLAPISLVIIQSEATTIYGGQVAFLTAVVAEVDTPETATRLLVRLCDVVGPLLHDRAAALEHVTSGVGTLDAAHGMT